MTDDISFNLKGLHKKGRYAVTTNGYVFDRRLFKILSAGIIILCAITLIKMGGFVTYAYASCPEDTLNGYCENPLYGECEEVACLQETLLPGEEVGEKPPSLAVLAYFIIALTVFIFWLNHLGQNSKEYIAARGRK